MVKGESQSPPILETHIVQAADEWSAHKVITALDSDMDLRIARLVDYGVLEIPARGPG